MLDRKKIKGSDNVGTVKASTPSNLQSTKFLKNPKSRELKI